MAKIKATGKYLTIIEEDYASCKLKIKSELGDTSWNVSEKEIESYIDVLINYKIQMDKRDALCNKER